MNPNVCAVVLAAGCGTRMQSDLPKVLHEICGEPIIFHVLANLNEAGIDDIAAVTGHKAELVESAITQKYPGVSFVAQTEQLGTAHALMCARDYLKDKSGYVVVMCGDAPMQRAVVISDIVNFSREKDLDLCVLTARLSDPKEYGRIMRMDGVLTGIIETKECTPDQLKIDEINSGTYCFSIQRLLEILPEIGNDNAKKEYYLTDAVKLFIEKGYKVDAYLSSDKKVVMGVNTRAELAECEALMRDFINGRLMLGGVGMIDPKATYIGRNVKIGKNTVLYPNTFITDSIIGENNTIYSSRIENSRIGDNNKIDNCVIESSSIDNGISIGPFAHLRPGSIISDNVKIGNFVEIKDSQIGEGTKAAHLAYIGDAQVGKGVNFGCGIVTANYDGKDKHRTVISDGAFIGCNVNLIAPISIGKNSYIAAGSTITKDVRENSLVIARSKEEKVIDNFGKK